MTNFFFITCSLCSWRLQRWLTEEYKELSRSFCGSSSCHQCLSASTVWGQRYPDHPVLKVTDVGKHQISQSPLQRCEQLSQPMIDIGLRSHGIWKHHSMLMTLRWIMHVLCWSNNYIQDENRLKVNVKVVCMYTGWLLSHSLTSDPFWHFDILHFSDLYFSVFSLH